MHDQGALEKALKSIKTLPFEDALHRVVHLEAYESNDPKRLLYDEGPATSPDGQRFTPPGGEKGLYAAEDLLTAGAEFAGNVVNWNAGNAPHSIHFRIAARLTAVLDLCDQEILDGLGTTRKEILSAWRGYEKLFKKWPPTWTLGRAMVDSGRFQAIRYPSKKNPKGTCVLVFTGRLDGKKTWVRVFRKDMSIWETLP